QAAERDAVDRFVAGFLSDRVGSVFAARVSGVTRFGLFLTLEPSGGDGLVPISTLPNDFYEHDEASHSLIGRRTGNTYRLGDNVEALLIEADAITGSLVLHLVDGGKPNNTVTSRRQGKKVFSSRKKKRR
ncbi:MAG: S1 RNA-binding domain-containing protein, partial [Rhodospirillales bacterium]|nr:S1 RNA-binding domain-containing protein [Rhodospirillales bacterium]